MEDNTLFDRKGTVHLTANDDLQFKSPQIDQTFCLFPLSYRRFEVQFSSMLIIISVVTFESLLLSFPRTVLFTTVNHQ